MAAFWAALKTEEKNPDEVTGVVIVPPGVFASSMCGVNGEAASLLEVKVPALFRL